MNAWINQIFKAGQVNAGGVVRRSIATVQKYASEAELVSEVTKRGFHIVKTEGQYLILCNPGRLKILR